MTKSTIRKSSQTNLKFSFEKTPFSITQLHLPHRYQKETKVKIKSRKVVWLSTHVIGIHRRRIHDRMFSSSRFEGEFILYSEGV